MGYFWFCKEISSFNLRKSPAKLKVNTYVEMSTSNKVLPIQATVETQLLLLN